MDLQVRLLRVLETSAVTRVGGTAPVAIDVRVIAASNYPIEQAVSAGKLREDLLYRLNVIAIPMPPLRDRGEDVVLLAEHFLAELNARRGHAPTLRGRLRSRGFRTHRWPGNVRELKNLVERAFILTDGDLDVEGAGGGRSGSGDIQPAERRKLTERFGA